MFILAEKASFPIDWMCRKLKVSRASFYRSLRPAVPTPTPTQVRYAVLDAHVVRVYEREKGMAGFKLTKHTGTRSPPFSVRKTSASPAARSGRSLPAAV